MNKKAFSSVMVEILVACVVVGLCFVFIIMTYAFFKENAKLTSDVGMAEPKEWEKGYLFLENSFNNLLLSKINVDNKDVILSDFIKNSNIEDVNKGNIFKERCNVIYSSFSPKGNLQGIYSKVWMRVIGMGEQIDSSESKSTFICGDLDSCDPLDKENSIVLVRFVPDKKVVLCLDKEYYKNIEVNGYG